jgi:hypothetical protein
VHFTELRVWLVLPRTERRTLQQEFYQQCGATTPPQQEPALRPYFDQLPLGIKMGIKVPALRPHSVYLRLQHPWSLQHFHPRPWTSSDHPVLLFPLSIFSIFCIG